MALSVVRSPPLADAIRVATHAVAAGSGPEAIAEELYTRWYCAPVAEVERPAALPDDLVGALRAAHAGSDHWENGWMVEQAGRDGRIVAERHGQTRMLDRCEYVATDRPGLVAVPGASVLAPKRRDHLSAEDGWWYTHHEAWRLDAPEPDLVRVYWNCDPAAAAAVVRKVSSLLLGTDVPWMLKCAIAPGAYYRADAVVLFMPGAQAGELRRAVDDARRALSGALRAGAPPLTLRLGQGVAVAADPGTGESFGQHRCRLIAEGMAAAQSDADLLETIVEHLFRAGVAPERPWAACGKTLPWE